MAKAHAQQHSPIFVGDALEHLAETCSIVDASGRIIDFARIKVVETKATTVTLPAQAMLRRKSPPTTNSRRAVAARAFALAAVFLLASR